MSWNRGRKTWNAPPRRGKTCPAVDVARSERQSRLSRIVRPRANGDVMFTKPKGLRAMRQKSDRRTHGGSADVRGCRSCWLSHNTTRRPVFTLNARTTNGQTAINTSRLFEHIECAITLFYFSLIAFTMCYNLSAFSNDSSRELFERTSYAGFPLRCARVCVVGSVGGCSQPFSRKRRLI